MPKFEHQGRRIAYEVHGEGDRVLVLIHGLLMNRHMFDRLGPEMTARGNRVVTVDLLGHGESDRPPEMVNYAMGFFAQQVVGLLDELEIDEAVIGGTSLGANTTLTVARMAPERVRGMMVEMPVLDNALLGVSVIFTPILLGLRFGYPLLRRTAALANRIPRTNYMLDLWLDLVRQDPAPSAAVLAGLFLGPGAPHHDERVKMQQPALGDRPPRRSPAPLLRLGNARRGAPERAPDRGQLDPRMAHLARAPRRRAGGLPRRGLGGGRSARAR